MIPSTPFPSRPLASASRTGVHLLLAASLLAQVSCVNLSAVRDFASSSTDVTGYTKLTQDYVATPRRLMLYQPRSQYAELDRQTRQRTAQEAGIKALHTGMTNYLAAIASLAADEVIQYDDEIDSLTGALEKASLPGVGSTELAAFGALTKLVAKAATDAYRQNQLKQIIAEGNAPFAEVVSSMEFIVAKTYPASLMIEKEALDKRWNTIVHSSDAPEGSDAAIQLLKLDTMAKMDAVNAKIQACSVYASALTKIRQGHQSLYDNRNKLPSKEVIRQLKTYRKDVETLGKTVKELIK